MDITLNDLWILRPQPVCHIKHFCSDAPRVRIRGTNGSGKTSLLLALCGVNNLSKGEILIDGKPRSFTQRSSICNLMSNAIELPNATVAVLLKFLMSIASNEKALFKLADDLEILKYQDSSCTQLSAGNTQKIRFLTAIARTPHILCLDEPLEHLDNRSRELISQAIEDYPKQIWFVDHTNSIAFSDQLQLAPYQ